MRIVFHIGPHKTGTTAVQSGLHAVRDALLAEGILYPESIRTHFAHHRLAFAMAGQRDEHLGDRPATADVLAALSAEVEDARPEVLLLSSEVFSLAKPEGLAALAAWCGGREATVVAALRHPVEVFLSIYNQRTKSLTNGYAKPVRALLGRCVAECPTLDMEAVLDRWAAALPAARLVVAPYAREGMERVVLEAAGARTPFPARGVVRNDGMDGRVLELVRLAKAARLGPDEVRAVAHAAEARFKGASGLVHVPAPTLRDLFAELCPLYDRAYPRFLGQPNPFRPEDWQAFRARLAPEVGAQQVMELMAALWRADREAPAPRG